jgi:hypothetical protein
MNTLYYGDNLKILRDHIKGAPGWFGPYAFLIALVLTGPAAPQKVVFASGKDARNIPFELGDRDIDNHIYLQATVNDSSPLRFILDTGASHSFLSLRTAQRLGLSLSEIGKVSGGIGDDLPSVWDIDELVSLKLPGVTLPARKMVAVKTDSLDKCINNAAVKVGIQPRLADGVLGADLFDALVVAIDYKRKQIDLYDPKNFRDDGKGIIVKLKFEKNSGYILARVRVKGTLSEETDLLVVIDIGAGDVLTLGPLIWKEKNLPPPADVTSLVNDCGIGGEDSVPTMVGDLDWLKIGHLTLSQPVTRFSQTILSPEYHDGILGNAALRNFSGVVFDYRHSRMIVTKP